MSEEADTPFDRFRRAGASQHQLLMLATALREAPDLARRVTQAMNPAEPWYGDLTRIGVLEAGGSLGHYSGNHREIRFDRALLDADINKESVDAVVDVFSHEIEHALRRREMLAFDDAFERKAYTLAGQPGPRDATALVQDYIDKGRQQEALAELAGINGLADRMKAEGNGPVTESGLAERLRRTSSCVEPDGNGGFRFKAGIEFDPVAQSVAVNAQNLEAVGKHFFDVDRGTHDYKAQYAAAAISAIARGDRAQQIDNPLRPLAQTRIDLAALGVDPKDLGAQDYNFGEPPPGPFAFIDSSPGRAQVMEVAHTAQAGARETAPTLSAGDAELLQRIRQTVQASGSWNDVQAGNIAAALLLETRRDPMLQRIDDVLVATGRDGVQHAFGVYRPYGDKPPALHADIQIDKAIQQPMHDTLTQLVAVNQQIALNQQQEQQRREEEVQRQGQARGSDTTQMLAR